MSRIGKQPVTLPTGVTAEVSVGEVRVVGPKGELKVTIPRGISVKKEENKLLVLNEKNKDNSRALHGTTRSLIQNVVQGVSDGWRKTLELVGTGYRAEVSGKDLVLTVGYSHPVKIAAPDGVTFRVEKSVITVEGIDKEVVGQVSALIREVRPPEPYKGKGIRYTDEYVRRKAGKAAKAAGAA